jgi:hypothetical protein
MECIITNISDMGRRGMAIKDCRWTFLAREGQVLSKKEYKYPIYHYLFRLRCIGKI